MCKIKGLILIFSIITFTTSQAADFIAAEIGHHTTTQMNGTAGNTFLSDEVIKMNFELQIVPEDRGIERHLYLVAVYQNRFFMKNAAGSWVLWDGQRDTLTAYKNSILQEKENLEVLSGDQLPPGEYLVFAGYQSGTGTIIYNVIPATLAVFDPSSAALHRIQNKAFLAELLDLGSASGSQPVFAEDDVASALDPGISPGSVSQTNVQEQGVDEADRIKTNGVNLFALERCPGQTGECLTAYKMIQSPASTRKLGQIGLNSNHQDGQIYLYRKAGATDQNKVIWLSTSFMTPVIGAPEIFPYPNESNTEINFIDARAPEAMKVIKSLSIDSSLVSSRLLNDTLYLVTRKNPVIFPVPLDGAAEDAEQTTPLNKRLPSITFNNTEPRSLIEPTDCFIPAKSSAQISDSTLVTITAIPVESPENYQSLCLVGTVETVYASTRALYLATSHYANQIQGNLIIYDPDPNYRTDIHKFSFSDNDLDYQGSGQVPGHLGWDMDKRSFRMGEYDHILKVATSLGETWNDTSRTRVAVLQEGKNKELQEISFLDNLGKPGEKLYAARFIGNRGYLVTFKVTDPLFMLDFSTPVAPKILGELEINGYSDYLHPIGENLLLGIGKDAIADEIATRGAWYQGVKLTLFDVSDGANPEEINSIILGKRGTTSAILFDHHALALLPTDDNTEARLAIPVDLHDTPDQTSQFDPDNPSTFYDWTHTGLYTFTINTADDPGITLAGKLITDSKAANDQKNFNSLHDRPVIQGNTVHYIHNDAVFSSGIQDLQ